MYKIASKPLTVYLDGAFQQPVAYNPGAILELSTGCFEMFQKYGLRASDISSRKSDEVFDYEFTFSLFGGNATFKLTSEKVLLKFMNVATDDDVKVVTEISTSLFSGEKLPRLKDLSVDCFGHFTFVNPESATGYFSRFASGPSLKAVGFLGWAETPSWAPEIKICVDRSLAFDHSAFISWTTKVPGSKLSPESFKQVEAGFTEALTIAGLSTEK